MWYNSILGIVGVMERLLFFILIINIRSGIKMELFQPKEPQDLSTITKALKQILQIQDDQNEENKPLVLTVKNAAEELQVSIPTLREHFLCRPDFPKLKAGSKILIPRKAFEEWVNGFNTRSL